MPFDSVERAQLANLGFGVVGHANCPRGTLPVVRTVGLPASAFPQLRRAEEDSLYRRSQFTRWTPSEAGNRSVRGDELSHPGPRLVWAPHGASLRHPPDTSCGAVARPGRLH